MEKIKSYLKKSLFFVLLMNYRRIFIQKRNLKKYDDETAVRKIYKERLGRELDLDNPQRFTEKLQWLKINYRKPIMSKIVDKISIRDYLTEKGYGDYLMPIVGTYNSVDEIDFKNLPEKCIFKASCGSSMHLVKNGRIKHLWLWKAIMKSWLKMNIYVEGREWPYKDAKHGIICEHFIEARTDNKLKDYKFFCFKGQPEFIQVDVDLLKDHRINFYDKNWVLQPIRCQFPNSDTDVKKPHNFDLMVKFAKDLSKDFPHVRVDFYEYDDELKIGELTFFDGSGFYNFHPDEYDFIFGEKIFLK